MRSEGCGVRSEGCGVRSEGKGRRSRQEDTSKSKAMKSAGGG